MKEYINNPLNNNIDMMDTNYRLSQIYKAAYNTFDQINTLLDHPTRENIELIRHLINKAQNNMDLYHY
jgi:hypothetical protein